MQIYVYVNEIINYEDSILHINKLDKIVKKLNL